MSDRPLFEDLSEVGEHRSQNRPSSGTGSGPVTPDDDSPVTVRLTHGRLFPLFFGLALLIEAGVIMRHVIRYPEQVEVPVPVAVTLLTLLLLFLIGGGVGCLWAFFRKRRHKASIDARGLALRPGGLRLDWTELEAVGVLVTTTDPPYTGLLPAGRAKAVLVSLVWRPRPGVEDAHALQHLAVRSLPRPFTHRRTVAAVPHTADPDVPIALDLDAALRRFAGSAYRPRVTMRNARGVKP